MELLRTVEDGGYPAAYLRGRIGGRKGYRLREWELLLAAADPLDAVPATPYRGALGGRSEEEVWKSLLREFAWVYRQMEKRLRDAFAPVFGWFELHTLILCLRNRAGRNSAKIEELLAFSLLAAGLQKVLRRDGDLAAAVEGVTGVFAAGAVKYGRLRGIYPGQGLAGFERELTNLYLEQVAGGPLQPVIGEFFRRHIDLKNIMALYKQLRWRIKTPPSFIKGGTIGWGALREVAEGKDPAGVASLAGRLAGREVAAAGPVEVPLLAGLTRLVRRWGREPEGIGLVLAYLWEGYVEARNLSIIIHGRDLDREMVRGELIP